MDEAAAYLGVGVTKLREFMADGLDYADFGYRTPRFRRRWLDDYTERRRVRHAPTEERAEGTRQEP